MEIDPEVLLILSRYPPPYTLDIRPPSWTRFHILCSFTNIKKVPYPYSMYTFNFVLGTGVSLNLNSFSWFILMERIYDRIRHHLRLKTVN